MKLKFYLLLLITLFLFSCDGGWIMIFLDEDTSTTDTYLSIVGADGENFQHLVKVGFFRDPIFSNDGLKIISLKHNLFWSGNIDGTDFKCILDSVKNNDGFSVSPNTSELIFSNYYGLYKFNYENLELSELLDANESHKSFPQYSPDGTKILFTATISYEDSTLVQLYTINNDGSNQELIYQHYSNSWKSIKFPHYSSNMEKIFFINASSNRLVMINSDGSNPEVLYSGSISDIEYISSAANFVVFSDDYDEIICCDFISNTSSVLGDGNNPVISPDATHISFYGFGENDKYYFYIIDIDGSNKKKIARSSGRTHSYSNDSERIVFFSEH